MKRVLIAFKIIALTLALSACGGGGGGGGGSTTPSSTAPAASTATQLSISQALFAEKSLSASGQLSCASCHTDETAHSTAPGVSLPVGGVLMNQQLSRSSPSLMYKSTTPIFSFNAGEAIGGFDWDGRVNSLADQSAGPLLASAEMANANINTLVAKVRALSYFKDFASVFNVPANATDQQVYDILRTAFETYQRLDPDYLLFNSKFDRFLDGTVSLSASEERGRQLFNNPNKGNCASCHSSQIGPGQQRPLFTNFRYAALGVPRNNTSTVNQNASFFDMGLCGPVRTDLTARTDLCGQFKIPTLRNIAITAPYFHNSAIDTLTNAVRFYATRDSNPALWYPTVNGAVVKFNDLPTNLRGNVPVNRAPFNSNLSAQEIGDIVAFLLTLTDDRTAPASLATIRN